MGCGYPTYPDDLKEGVPSRRAKVKVTINVPEDLVQAVLRISPCFPGSLGLPAFSPEVGPILVHENLRLRNVGRKFGA